MLTPEQRLYNVECAIQTLHSNTAFSLGRSGVCTCPVCTAIGERKPNGEPAVQEKFNPCEGSEATRLQVLGLMSLSKAARQEATRRRESEAQALLRKLGGTSDDGWMRLTPEDRTSLGLLLEHAYKVGDELEALHEKNFADGQSLERAVGQLSESRRQAAQADDARQKWRYEHDVVAAERDAIRQQVELMAAELTSASQHAASLNTALTKAEMQRDEFKGYVHGRFDAAGVPIDPEPEKNKEHGCRIEGRINWLLAERTRMQQRQEDDAKAMFAVCDALDAANAPREHAMHVSNCRSRVMTPAERVTALRDKLFVSKDPER